MAVLWTGRLLLMKKKNLNLSQVTILSGTLLLKAKRKVHVFYYASRFLSNSSFFENSPSYLEYLQVHTVLCMPEKVLFSGDSEVWEEDFKIMDNSIHRKTKRRTFMTSDIDWCTEINLDWTCIIPY